jgi:hypothetical protein
MSDLAIIEQHEPTSPRKPDKTLRVTGKIRVAIEAMVWDGLPRAQAAEKAGISEHGLYKAFRKPPVKAFYLKELEVLRSSERARSLFRMVELREQDDNKMVAFNAAKELAGSAEDQRAGAQAQSLPGLVVQINVTQQRIGNKTVIDNESE